MHWLINMFRPRQVGKYSHIYEHQGANFSECGPACLTMLLRKSRPQLVTSHEICRGAKPTPSWWTARDIVEAGHELGLVLNVREYQLDRRAGVYLSTYLGFGHWVVAWKDGAGTVHVLGPKRGYFTMTPRQFRNTLKSNIYVSSSLKI